VTYNDPELAELLYEHSQNLAEVLPANPSSAGEDFAFYQEKLPGVFAFIGSNGAENAPDLHHDSMVIDDEAFLTMLKAPSSSCSTTSKKPRNSCLKADKEKLSPP